MASEGQGYLCLRHDMMMMMMKPIDRTQSGATTPNQSGPGTDSNEEVLCIPQCSSINGNSPSDCLLPYPGHSLTTGVVLRLRRDGIVVFYSPSKLSRECSEKLGHLRIVIIFVCLTEDS